nr:hypothetical protein [Pedobacter sp. ASV19]
MQGLGYVGLEKTAEARTFLSKVLQLDAEHQGAKTHIDMLV